MKKNSTYDDGEGECPGDPTLDDVNPDDLQELQDRIDEIEAMENPVEKKEAVEAFVKELANG